MSNIELVENYLKETPTFYLTTVDGNKPKYAEICASKGKDFLRYYGNAVFEQDYKIADMVLSNAPTMQNIYNEKTGYKLGIFHLKSATAEFRSMMGIKESVQFDE